MTRGKLDQIEDMNLAVAHTVHKGHDEATTRLFLEKRGASPEQIDIIFMTIRHHYTGVRQMESSKLTRAGNALIDSICVFIPIGLMFHYMPGDSVFFSNELVLCVLFVWPFLYYFIQELFTGQTLGKRITGSAVVDNKGVRPSLGRIFIRTISRFIPYDIFAFIISDRLLHDRLPGTYVVDRKRWEKAYRLDQRPDKTTEILHN